MGNEQSAESVTTEQPGAQSASPSLEEPQTQSRSVLPFHKQAPSPPPKTSPSPSKSQKQKRTSTRKIHWTRCSCTPKHSSRQACRADPKSGQYTGSLSPTASFMASRDPSPSDDSELEFAFKAERERSEPSNLDRSSPSPSSPLLNPIVKPQGDAGTSTKTPKKRPAPAKKCGRAVRAKRTRSGRAREKGCGCAEEHGSLAECEREREREEMDVRTAIIVSSQGMVVVHVSGENEAMKRSFVVHRELLMLHSSFFRSLLTEKVKVETKEDENMAIKSEEIETPTSASELTTILDAKTEAELTLEKRKERLKKTLERIGGMKASWPPEESGKKDEQNGGGDRTRESSLCDVRNPYEASDDDNLDSPMIIQGVLNRANKAKQQQLKPENVPPTTRRTTSPRAPTTPSSTELYIPTLSAINFASFLSYLYTGTISLSISDLQFTDTNIPPLHIFPTLYLFATKLGCPEFMNYIMTSHRRNMDRDPEWPSVEQVRFNYTACAGYMPVPLKDHAERTQSKEGEKGNETAGGIGIEGVKVLRRFTAACIAANHPFMRYEEGSRGYEEWTKLFQEYEGMRLGIDVLREGNKWDEGKPWEECWRKEWVVDEKGLGERWEEEIVSGERRREWSVFERGAEAGEVRSVLHHQQYGVALMTE